MAKPNGESKTKQAKNQAKGVSPISGTPPPVASRFQKGKSGNPHGRPKDLKQLRTLIRSIAAEDSTVKPGINKLEAMIDRMLISPQSADRKEILRYGWGEPPQTVNVKIEDVDRAISDELARLAGRSKTENAGTAEADADADSGQAAA